ncbi:MAG: hypothetical protein LUE09_00970 [Synergistaceae bacterium]|nr:hypothetical protein [Synergistaceae bacterium]
MKIQLDDERIIYLSQADERLKNIFCIVGSIETREHADGYSFLIYEIVGQMLSNKVADIMTSRLNALCDGNVSVEVINNLSFEQLKSIGISSAKVRYIKSLTTVMIENPSFLEVLPKYSDGDAIEHLKQVKGIGNWTAKMYLLFVLQREDILPYEDGAFIQAYKWLYETENVSKNAIVNNCAKWKPYTSIAARYMYTIYIYCGQIYVPCFR